MVDLKDNYTEVLTIRRQAIEDAADELERQLRTFPAEGKNTRAGWAVNHLRLHAARIAEQVTP